MLDSTPISKSYQYIICPIFCQQEILFSADKRFRKSIQPLNYQIKTNLMPKDLFRRRYLIFYGRTEDDIHRFQVVT